MSFTRIATLVALASAFASGSPTEPLAKRSFDDNFKQNMLDSHNFFRAQHGADPLYWDDDVAGVAQDNVNQCIFQHTNGGDARQYGSNIAEGDYAVATHAVDDWALERQKYDFNNPGFSKPTGHFTQVVWKDTTALGCAYKWCGEGNSAYHWYLACNYRKSGNYNNEFPQNVLTQRIGRPGDVFENGNTVQDPSKYQIYICKDFNRSGTCYGVQANYGECASIPSYYNDEARSLGGDLRTACTAYSDGGCQGRKMDIGKGQQMDSLPSSMDKSISSFYCPRV